MSILFCVQRLRAMYCYDMNTMLAYQTQEAMRRCPRGFFCEIKYDGERIQLHKNGNNFRVRCRGC